MAEIERFTKAERALHSTNAAAVFFLLITGGIMFKDLDHWKIAGINVISQAHFWLGGILLLLGGAIAFLVFRRRTIPFAHKRFNPGQRVSLNFVRFMLGFMTLSGLVIYVGKLMGMSKHTLHFIKHVHLYGAWLMVAFILAHVAMVLLVPKNRGIIESMKKGSVDRKVAMKVSPDWVESLEADLEAKLV